MVGAGIEGTGMDGTGTDGEEGGLYSTWLALAFGTVLEGSAEDIKGTIGGPVKLGTGGAPRADSAGTEFEGGRTLLLPPGPEFAYVELTVAGIDGGSTGPIDAGATYGEVPDGRG